MGLTAISGPFVVHGPGPYNLAGNQSVLPVTPDAGPSLIFEGTGLFDSRYVYKGGAGTENSPLIAIGAGLNTDFVVLDQAPSTAVVNNIAVAANVTSGTAVTLVSTTAAGITVMAASLTIPQTGNVVPAVLAIDLQPGLVLFGNNKSIGIADPTKNLARAVSITGASSGAGGAFLVVGYDLYGSPQTEKITATSGATTTNGKKAFKFVKSVTPQFTDAHNYSVGTADIFGFPLVVSTFTYATIGWAGSTITASTGFTAAVTTTASNTTGDVRGTYAVQSASNGVLTLQAFITVSTANISSIAGIFGTTPA